MTVWALVKTKVDRDTGSVRDRGPVAFGPSRESVETHARGVLGLCQVRPGDFLWCRPGALGLEPSVGPALRRDYWMLVLHATAVWIGDPGE